MSSRLNIPRSSSQPGEKKTPYLYRKQHILVHLDDQVLLISLGHALSDPNIASRRCSSPASVALGQGIDNGEVVTMHIGGELHAVTPCTKVRARENVPTPPSTQYRPCKRTRWGRRWSRICKEGISAGRLPAEFDLRSAKYLTAPAPVHSGYPRLPDGSLAERHRGNSAAETVRMSMIHQLQNLKGVIARSGGRISRAIF